MAPFQMCPDAACHAAPLPSHHPQNVHLQRVLTLLLPDISSAQETSRLLGRLLTGDITQDRFSFGSQVVLMPLAHWRGPGR